MNAIQLLKNDHSTVKNLFIGFAHNMAAATEVKAELFAQIRRELQVHSRVEEEIFYPALKAFNGEGQRLVAESVREHQDIDELLIQASRLKFTDDRFEEKLELLMDSFMAHVEREEGEIFQFAQENWSSEQLLDLGRQIEERKETLFRQLAAA